MRPTCLAWLFILGSLCACGSGKPRAPFVASGTPVLPGCFAGPFAREAEGLLPTMAPRVLVQLGPSAGLDARTEPGCTPPFRDNPDDVSVLDAGRVEGFSLARSGGARRLLGRGTMKIARGQLDLELHDDAHETTLALTIRASHVRISGKLFAAFEGEVDPSESSPLQLPIDALVQALTNCREDQRLLRSEDGNIVKARRADHTIWRMRWVDLAGTALVDTSSMCDDGDARMLWRSAMGTAGPLIAAASARSPIVLTLTRQLASVVDEIAPGSM